MSPEDIVTVQSTWSKVLPIKEAAGQIFRERLLETDRSLECLCQGDIREQGMNLVRVIDAAVTGLSRLERFAPLIQAIGRRFAGRGVRDHHYVAIGAALLWTLDKALGAEFTPKVNDAWTTVYGELATTMRDAAAVTWSRNTGHMRQSSQKDVA